MAHSTHAPTAPAILAPFARFFTALFDGLVRLGENNSKVRQVASLNALSDEELAARGLKREDIARHVLSGYYWV